MNTLLASVLLLCVCSAVVHVSAYGEPYAHGLPQWQDRVVQALTNAVRIAPVPYKRIYMTGGQGIDTTNVFLTNLYPPVAPLYFSSQLENSAYAYSSASMAAYRYEGPEGAVYAQQSIAQYYNCDGGTTKNYTDRNIAIDTDGGYQNYPVFVTNQMICSQNWQVSTTVCPVDANAPMRATMMNGYWQITGVSYDTNSSSPINNIWTQDMAPVPCSPAPTNPIYGATHLYMQSMGYYIKFIAIFYLDTVAPSSAQVWLNGTNYNLNYEFGQAAGKGNFVTTQPIAYACRNYYFQFVSSGKTYRYPDTGFLVTYGEGACTTTYVAA